MSTKRAIKRMFLTLMWLGVAAGMFIIVSAAIKVQDANICKGYDIKITGSGHQLFTSKDQVEKLLKAATKGNIIGQRLNEFDLPKIEDLLEQSSWVYNAQLYFDNLDILRVNVIERKPLARVFTAQGESFYIDAAGKQIPLSDKISLDVPVFTGYPTKKVLNATDSVLLQNVIATASFISSDSFWASQVSQIDISSCGADCWKMEMVPVVGNHRVMLGDGSDIASKFHRLYLLYDQVLKRKGFDKYQKIDVQYDGQIVGIKGAYNKIDSLQLRKNIENLLQQSRTANELIEEAPGSGYVQMLVQDTSAEAMRIYRAVENGIADSVSLQAVGMAENVEKKPPLPVAVAAAKAASLKAASKPETKTTAPNKEPVKKQVAVKETPKKEIEKAVVKNIAHDNTATKKNEVKKAAPHKQAIAEARNKKPAVKQEVAKKEIKGSEKATASKNERNKVLPKVGVNTHKEKTDVKRQETKKAPAKSEVKKPVEKNVVKPVAAHPKKFEAKPVSAKKKTNE